MAYALPSIERIRDKKLFEKEIQIVVIVPTRELAVQVNAEFKLISNQDKDFKSIALYGGMDIRQQIQDFKRSPHQVIVATPGRILDLIERKIVDFS